MKPKSSEKRALARGRYSSRLSNRPSSGRHKQFRGEPGFFRLAVESLSEYALITTDGNRRISSWSGPAARMFGYTEKEIIGESISLIFTPEDVAQGIDKQEFVEALKEGRQDDERWHVRKGGQRLWCYGLAFPLKDDKGGVRGFVKLIRDDSERKRTNDILREKEERLRLAAESTGLGTWDYDVASRRLMLSPRAAELFGLGKEAKDWGFEQLTERVHRDDRSKIMGEFDQCVAAGGNCQSEMEYRITMPDGSVRWVRALARAFFANDGARKGDSPSRLIGTVIDITGARRLQLEAQELNQELEARVRSRTEHLSALNKELESFAYSASHDLRAPLRKIAAFSEAILRSGASKLSPTDKSYFDRIRVATFRMHRLIDDMLNLARVSRKSVEMKNCDLSAIAREIAGELRTADPERRVDFVIASGVKAEADCELLGIAMRNLLENAWKFTGKHTRARIEFGVKTIDDRRVYFVKDDGAGFDMRYAHKLFGAFRRLHSDDQFPGTGVGLGMVERIMRRHRGRVWAEAKVEGGATFFFTLSTEAE